MEDVDLGRFFELATTNKRYVNGRNLHETKREILDDYTGDFEFSGSMLIGKKDQKANIRFRNVDDYEKYINAIDNGGYDCEDVIFSGRLCKLNISEFNKGKGSQFGKGIGFKQNIVEN